MCVKYVPSIIQEQGIDHSERCREPAPLDDGQYRTSNATIVAESERVMTDTPNKALPKMCKKLGLRLEIYRKPRDVHDVFTARDGENEWKHYSYLVGIRLLDEVIHDIPWKQGTGHVYKPSRGAPLLEHPEVEDVVYSLVLDADACSQTFDEWCNNYGYNNDSRKALAMYLKCQELGTKIRRLLGKHFEAVRKAARGW